MSNCSKYDYECLKYIFNKYFLSYKKYEEDFIINTLGQDNTLGIDYLNNRRDEMNNDYSYFMEILNDIRES